MSKIFMTPILSSIYITFSSASALTCSYYGERSVNCLRCVKTPQKYKIASHIYQHAHSLLSGLWSRPRISVCSCTQHYWQVSKMPSSFAKKKSNFAHGRYNGSSKHVLNVLPPSELIMTLFKRFFCKTYFMQKFFAKF